MDQLKICYHLEQGNQFRKGSVFHLRFLRVLMGVNFKGFIFLVFSFWFWSTYREIESPANQDHS